MANSNMLENVSQRRIEALKFLSCISLDGTFASSVQNFQDIDTVNKDFLNDDTKKCCNILDGNIITEEICDGGHVSKEYYSTQIANSNKCDNGDCNSLSSDSDNISISHKPFVDEPIITTHILSYPTKNKKCTRISNGEAGAKSKILTSSRKKKLHHSSTCSDSERHYDSSNESICPNATSRLKTKGTACKAITELNSKSNVKFIKSVKDHKFNGERIIMVTRKRLPVLVCSFIPYGASEKNRSDVHKEVLRKRHTSRSRPMSTAGETSNQFELFGIIKSEDGQEVSYGKLLVPTHSFKEYLEKKQISDSSTDLSNPTLGHNRHLLARCYSYDQGAQRGTTLLATSPPLLNSKENVFVSPMVLYNPTLLDDPELITGKHRTLLTFSSYVTSVIDYVRPCDLKREMNDKFKEKFPHIKLTLSKLRSIKKEMCKIARTESGTELLTIAQAYVYFEKLILRGLINKQNRKLCAAASLLLSAKLNDFKGDALRVLIERMENVFRLNRRELFESEFAVLVALEFGLHIPASEMFPHYQRLLYES